jgi:hypothetical protein
MEMKRLEQYRAAAIELALKQGATPENVKEIAGKMRMIDIAEYIKKGNKHEH